jgi:hypothetical protein
MAGDLRRLALALVAASAAWSLCVPHTGAWAAPGETEAPAQDGKEAHAKPSPKKKKQDLAEAQRGLEAALKQLESGESEKAVHRLTAILAAGGLPPATMAKALLYRGIAYRQQKKPAQAIADLTSALWLKGGLSASDRSDALRQRTAAYQEAGLTEGGATQTAAVPREARSKTGGWGAATTTALNAAPDESAQPAAQSGGWNFLGNLFSGFSAPASPPASSTTTGSVAKEPATSAAQNGRRPTVGSSWVRHTEVRGDAAREQPAAIASKPEGRFRVQVAVVRTQAEAQALAAKVKREHGAILASREPDIDQAVVGNMGSFYRVRVGPFATQNETHALCAKLKSTGLDCLVVTQ